MDTEKPMVGDAGGDRLQHDTDGSNSVVSDDEEDAPPEHTQPAREKQVMEISDTDDEWQREETP